MGVERWTKEQKPLRIMKVEIVPLEDIYPHEAIIGDELDDFCNSLKSKGVFFRPILLDRTSHVVLDGHHRVEGLRRIGATKVPAILLDYSDDEIELHTWYPLIWEEPEAVAQTLSEIATVECLPEDEAMARVDSGQAALALFPQTGEGVPVVDGDITALLAHLSKEYSLEYVDTLDFMCRFKDAQGTVLYRRAPTKEEVIQKALAGEVYPPKTTRHYLPFRYQDIRIKLSYLY